MSSLYIGRITELDRIFAHGDEFKFDSAVLFVIGACALFSRVQLPLFFFAIFNYVYGSPFN